MKRLRFLTTLIFAIWSSFIVYAQRFIEDGIIYNIIAQTPEDCRVQVVGSELFKVKIPSIVTHDGIRYQVTGIGDNASFNKDLESITIPNSIRVIANDAFEGCGDFDIYINDVESWLKINYIEGYNTHVSSYCLVSHANNIYIEADGNIITEIEIPTSLNRIPEYAFRRFTTITSVKFHENVTSIGEYAFSGCSSLINVNLPESVISIEREAFSDCSNLTSINIPESVTSIKREAFKSCSSLTNISIPSLITEIEMGTFSGCNSLATVKLPENLLSIRLDAFKKCRNLKSIEIPKGITLIEESVFLDCSNLQSISGSNIESIKDSAFYGCYNLEQIDFQEDLAEIGNYAFYDCKKLKSPIYIRNGVKEFGNYAFYNCSSLSLISIPASITSFGIQAFNECAGELHINCNIPLQTFPYFGNGEQRNFYNCKFSKIHTGDNVRSIGAYAFANCNTLDSVFIFRNVKEFGSSPFINCTGKLVVDCNIPSPFGGGSYGPFSETYFSMVIIGDNVNSIGKYAFNNSDSLKTIVLSNSVSSIEKGAFKDCKSLTDIHISSIDSWLSIKYEDLESRPHHTGNNINLYTNNKLLTNVIIPQNVKAISPYAFYNCKNIVSINLPNKLENIQEYAFAGCANLSSLSIPNSVADIGGYAFAGCDSLYTINLSYGLSRIKEYAFHKCVSLSSINIPSSVIDIEKFAFSECTNLSSVNIYQGTEYIGESAFSKCSNLLKIEIPSGVTQIYNGTFEDCHNLTNVTIPYGVTWIGNFAFSECSSLKEIFIPESVMGFGAFAFCNCKNLTTINIPDKVSSIKNNTFRGCNNLSSISFPDKLNIIESRSFEGCNSLTTVIFPQNLTTIEEYAFDSCDSLTSISLPESIETLGIFAFGYCHALEEILAYSKEPKPIHSTVFSKDTYEKAILYVPNGAKESYLNSDTWNHFSNIVEMQKIDVEEIILNTNSIALAIGDRKRIQATIIPDNATDKTIIWNSSNNNIARVLDGVVIAKNKGVATITAEIGGKSTTCTVTVAEDVIEVTDLTLNKSELNLIEGESSSITALILPNNATNKVVYWQSSDENIVTVNKNGRIVAISEGVAKITAKIEELSATCMVTVEKGEIAHDGITSISQLSNTQLYYISQPQHSKGLTSWAVAEGGAVLKSNVDLGLTANANDTRQQFAFISNDGGATLYLYHAAEMKFVNKDGLLSNEPADPIYFKEGAYENTFFAYFDNNHQINVNGSKQMTIDTWSIADGGNSCTIVPIASFDPTEALKTFTVKVTGITLNQTTKTLKVGNSFTLTATVTPDNVTDRTVTWMTSNYAVANVSNGMVTAVGVGTATITAKAGYYSATCIVTVEGGGATDNGITSISQLSNTKLYYVSQPYRNNTSWAVAEGGDAMKSNVYLKLTADANDTRQQFAFISNDGGAMHYLYHAAEKKFVNKDGLLSNEPIAPIYFKEGAYANTFIAYFDESHYINITSSGYMTIDSWYTPDGGNSCVLVPVASFNPTEALSAFTVGATGITLDKKSAKMIEGENLQLTATVMPENATDKTVTWISTKPEVATVDENGVVTAIKAGRATITAKIGDIKATCMVTVEKKVVEVTEIKLDRTTASLEEGETLTLTATVAPDDATDKLVTWSSSKPEIATVDEKGVVSAIKAGRAIIYAMAGDQKASCVVTVKTVDSIVEVSNEQNKQTIYDLTGRRISNIEEIERGLYIINGKKVLIEK